MSKPTCGCRTCDQVRPLIREKRRAAAARGEKKRPNFDEDDAIPILAEMAPLDTIQPEEERKLATATLTSAVEALEDRPDLHENRAERRQVWHDLPRAIAFFDADDLGSIFSMCCQNLGLDPHATRDAMRDRIDSAATFMERWRKAAEAQGGNLLAWLNEDPQSKKGRSGRRRQEGEQ